MTHLVRAVLVAALALALAVPATPAHADDRRVSWRYLLDRAAQAAEKRAYDGEVLWITYEAGQPHVSTFVVGSSGAGRIEVTDRGRYDITLGDEGSGLADFERGWYVPLPAADLARAHKGLSRLERKYSVRIVGPDALLDRPATKVEIRRRESEELVERLWVDDRSGLLLRRESYTDGDELLRLVAYLRLDLDPDGSSSEKQGRGRQGTVRRRPEVEEVGEDQRRALQQAGWVLPDALPGGYVSESAFTVSAQDTAPLQVVYGDGLYTISLFQQRGAPDWDTLPPGAVRTEELGFPAYTWPGAVPRSYVWEASSTTFSLVGDAPPDDFAGLASGLPQPQEPGLLERLRRGFGRLWAWLSPWS